MKIALLLLTTFLFPATEARAAAPADAQGEISHLLTFVGESGCKFNRNGSWYDSKAAEDHLRQKYEYLEKKDRIHSAEDFIGKAATKSSQSGEPYQIQCGDGAAESSHDWLSDELARYRDNH